MKWGNLGAVPLPSKLLTVGQITCSVKGGLALCPLDLEENYAQNIILEKYGCFKLALFNSFYFRYIICHTVYFLEYFITIDISVEPLAIIFSYM